MSEQTVFPKVVSSGYGSMVGVIAPISMFMMLQLRSSCKGLITELNQLAAAPQGKPEFNL